MVECRVTKKRICSNEMFSFCISVVLHVSKPVTKTRELAKNPKIYHISRVLFPLDVRFAVLCIWFLIKYYPQNMSEMAIVFLLNGCSIIDAFCFSIEFHWNITYLWQKNYRMKSITDWTFFKPLTNRLIDQKHDKRKSTTIVAFCLSRILDLLWFVFDFWWYISHKLCKKCH